MSSLLSFSLNPPLTLHIHRKTYNTLALSLSRTSKFQIRATSSNSDREEIRWVREEQRWLREEQRWLREEQRWNQERDSLLREISMLKLQIQALENRKLNEGVSVSDTISNIAGLLQVLKEKNLIAETPERGRAILVEEKIEEVVVEEQKEVIRVLEGVGKKRKTLRTGCEGEDVKAMQEALQKLGFYSGEEDIEFSSFSSGTERAVKTWQSTFDAPEDGIMTAELLERLYMEIENASTATSADQKGTTPTFLKGGENGAAVPSVTRISEIQQRVVKEEVDVTKPRVFLLGENRWEDSSRLSRRGKQVGSKTSTNCLTCRGEGRLMCIECDGTGEPNIEPQFMEWVGEDTKCPYCEGLGYTICDVCERSKTAI